MDQHDNHREFYTNVKLVFALYFTWTHFVIYTTPIKKNDNREYRMNAQAARFTNMWPLSFSLSSTLSGVPATHTASSRWRRRGRRWRRSETAQRRTTPWRGRTGDPSARSASSPGGTWCGWPEPRGPAHLAGGREHGFTQNNGITGLQLLRLARKNIKRPLVSQTLQSKS